MGALSGLLVLLESGVAAVIVVAGLLLIAVAVVASPIWFGWLAVRQVKVLVAPAVPPSPLSALLARPAVSGFEYALEADFQLD